MGRFLAEFVYIKCGGQVQYTGCCDTAAGETNRLWLKNWPTAKYMSHDYITHISFLYYITDIYEVWSLGLLSIWSDGLEIATGQSSWFDTFFLAVSGTF